MPKRTYLFQRISYFVLYSYFLYLGYLVSMCFETVRTLGSFEKGRKNLLKTIVSLLMESSKTPAQNPNNTVKALWTLSSHKSLLTAAQLQRTLFDLSAYIRHYHQWFSAVTATFSSSRECHKGVLTVCLN